MDNESIQNSPDSNQDSVNKTTIEISVPANNPDLYRYKVTDDLLLFLVDRPFNEYTQRKLASILDQSHRSIGMAVDVLEENDLLVINSEGNKKLIQINRDRIRAPDDPTLRIPQSNFQNPVRVARDKLVEELDDVLGIEVYGSVARGEADRQSDIDLWVLIREGRARAQTRVQDIARELANKPINGNRYDFHIVVESPDSVPTYTEEIAEIVRSGITIYETDEFKQFQSLMEGMLDER